LLAHSSDRSVRTVSDSVAPSSELAGAPGGVSLSALHYPDGRERVMSLVSEFREFIQRGNVIDMAVGVIIGGAFGRIVSSLVDGVLMPPIGLVSGGVNFRDLSAVIGGTPEKPVTVNYGAFIQTTIDFLIIALCVFLLVKGVNALKRPAPAAPAPPEEPPAEVKLLTEIRDLLRR